MVKSKKKVGGGNAPVAQNAMGRASFHNSWFSNWFKGHFNIFTPSASDLVNAPNTRVHSAESTPGNNPPFPTITPQILGVENFTQAKVGETYALNGEVPCPMKGGKPERKTLRKRRRMRKKTTKKSK